MNRRLAAIFCASVLASGSLAAASAASAASPVTRHSPWECISTQGTSSINSDGWNHSGQDTLICPFSDSNAITDTTSITTNNLEKSNVSTVTVNIQNIVTTAAISAGVCVTFSSNFGGSCSTFLTNSNSGPQTITPSLTAWGSHPTGYGYVQVDFNSSSDACVFKGITSS